MSLNPIKWVLRRRETVDAAADAAVDAYVRWRHESAAVQDAYGTWVCATAGSRPLAFDAYRAALDREEDAAKLYGELMRRVGHLAETSLAHQLAQIPLSGARS